MDVSDLDWNATGLAKALTNLANSRVVRLPQKKGAALWTILPKSDAVPVAPPGLPKSRVSVHKETLKNLRADRKELRVIPTFNLWITCLAYLLLLANFDRAPPPCK